MILYLLLAGAFCFLCFALWQESYDWRKRRKNEKAYWQIVEQLANQQWLENNHRIKFFSREKRSKRTLSGRDTSGETGNASARIAGASRSRMQSRPESVREAS